MISANELDLLTRLGKGQVSKELIEKNSHQHRIENKQLVYVLKGVTANKGKISHAVTIKCDIGIESIQ